MSLKGCHKARVIVRLARRFGREGPVLGSGGRWLRGVVVSGQAALQAHSRGLTRMDWERSGWRAASNTDAFVKA